MIKQSTFFALLAAMFLLAGCATSSLETNIMFNPGTDITSLKTYAWSDSPVALIGTVSGASNTQTSSRVRKSINRVLKARGYQLMERSQPHDFTVAVLLGVANDSSFAQHTFTKKYWAANGAANWSLGNGAPRGALSVVMINPYNDRQIYWQGATSENMYNNPQKDAKMIEKFASIIFKDFPNSRIR